MSRNYRYKLAQSSTTMRTFSPVSLRVPNRKIPGVGPNLRRCSATVADPSYNDLQLWRGACNHGKAAGRSRIQRAQGICDTGAKWACRRCPRRLCIGILLMRVVLAEVTRRCGISAPYTTSQYHSRATTVPCVKRHGVGPTCDSRIRIKMCRPAAPCQSLPASLGKDLSSPRKSSIRVSLK